MKIGLKSAGYMTRDGRWCAPNQIVEVEDDEGRALIASGFAIGVTGPGPKSPGLPSNLETPEDGNAPNETRFLERR